MRFLRLAIGTAAVGGWFVFAFSPRSEASAGPASLDHRALDVRALEGSMLHSSQALAMPTSIELVGRHLVLVDRYADRPIHVVSTQDGALVRSVGRAGEGPGEFQQLWSVSPAPEAVSVFWAFDMALGRLTRFDLADESTLDRPWQSQLLTLRANTSVTSVAWLAEDRLLGTGFFLDGRFGTFDGDGALLGTVGPIPEHEGAIPVHVLQHAYIGTLRARPDRARVVIALRHAGIIEIYDPDGTRLVRVGGPFPFEPVFEVGEGVSGPQMASGETLRFGYVDVAVTNDRIYALFSGRTRAGFGVEASLAKNIHVFDWSGRLEHSLELDADVIAIAVDTSLPALYAVRHDPSPAVLEYSLAPVR